MTENDGTLSNPVDRPHLTRDDYARAAAQLPHHVEPLVDHAIGRVGWLDGTHCWFVDHDADGDHYRVMDVATGQVRPPFDQATLAAALNAAAAADDDKPAARAGKLAVTDLARLPDGRLRVTWHGVAHVCDMEPVDTGDSAAAPRVTRCRAWAATLANRPGREPAVASPDGRHAVFVRDWNLWLRDLVTGAETALTRDGVEDYGYATRNAGWIHDDGAIVRWSPDSTKVATYRQDQRKVGEMYLLETRVGHPRLHRWKYGLVGDEAILQIEPVVIDIADGTLTRLDMPPQPRLSSLADTLACDPDEPGMWSDVQWAPDGRSLALVTTSRDRRQVCLRIADVATGTTRIAFEDHVDTYYESGHEGVCWRYLPESNQVIWFSEHTDWGHLYLRDLATGVVEHAITQGVGNVSRVVHLDRESRLVWFVGNARTPGLNPHYRQLWKVHIDTGEATLLTPEPADHRVTMSPDGRHVVDTYSTPVTAPVTVLRAADDGHVVATVARAGLARLEAAGWVPPEPFTVTARDGETVLYGMLFKPRDFDPARKYPLIDYIYPGPQTGSVRGFSFLPARGGHQALAELGFIVVAINGMGTPWRSKRFHDVSYGNLGDNTLPDQVAAIRQLAARHPWIDADRVGIWGHSGGGNATAAAMFRHPGLFKVGWAESGNHDDRNYENDWGEKYHGLLVENADGTTNYDSQANQLHVGGLRGRLMLVHGAMDDNVPVGTTFLVADALVKANKDFDMLILPRQRHAYGKDTDYVTRRRWDYFVRHLLGAEPPCGFAITRPDGV